MLELILFYLAYNVSIGLTYFNYKYWKNESRIIDIKVYLLLILVPFIGYGNWLYYNELQLNKKNNMPKKWYIWKNMMPLNKVYFFLQLVISFAFLFGLNLFDSDSDYGNGWFDLGADMFLGVIGVLMFLVIGFYNLIYWLVLIVLPKNRANNIELDFYKNEIKV